MMKEKKLEDEGDEGEALPLDVIAEGILRARTRDLVKFRSVCKSWNQLTRDRGFIRKHQSLHRGTLLGEPPSFFTSNQQDGSYLRIVTCSNVKKYNSVQVNMMALEEDETGRVKDSVKIQTVDTFSSYKMLPPCNGLLLIAHDAETPIYLFNPCTHEFTTLLENGNSFDKFTYCYGFGFDSLRNEFKLLRIYPAEEVLTWMEPSPPEYQHEVLTLGKDSFWRSLGFVPYRFSIHRGEAVHANGRLHWRGSNDDMGNEAIVAFDLRKEEFDHKPWPPCVKSTGPRWCMLHEFDGCLAMSMRKRWDFSLLDLWVLGDYESNTWSREHRISFENTEGSLWFGDPLTVWKGEILIHWTKEKPLAIYNTKLKTFREISIMGHDKVQFHLCSEVFIYREIPMTALFTAALRDD